MFIAKPTKARITGIRRPFSHTGVLVLNSVKGVSSNHSRTAVSGSSSDLFRRFILARAGVSGYVHIGS
jgi:hypothetical protein